ncbi:MAG: YbaB/EbfC family nucleoid-associated protein [Elusimicrobiota bacterium]|jgi:DNA-binding protein YbaB|nr:YbaB/EbfC family nucleoid-associated protein [Elusimicrobiota bacterium]
MKGFEKIGNMMSNLKQAKGVYSKMKNTEKMLEKKRIEVENEGVKVVMNGKQEIISLVFPEEMMQMKKSKAEGMVLKVLNLATKKVQKEIEEETKQLTGGLDMAKMMEIFK